MIQFQASAGQPTFTRAIFSRCWMGSQEGRLKDLDALVFIGAGFMTVRISDATFAVMRSLNLDG